jgi:opacity protein-like surface antigen
MLPVSKLHLLLASSLLMPLVAWSDEHKLYFQINAGAAFPDNYTDSGSTCDEFFGCSKFKYKEESDPGYVAGAAVGYRFSEWFRLEGEAMFQSTDLNKSVTKVNTQNFGSFTLTNDLDGQRERTTFLLNGYYDFKNSSAFTPYFTAGIGGYHLQITASQGRRSGENSVDFAWQFGAGLNYQLNDRMSLDMKYRFLGGADAEVIIPGDFFSRDRKEWHDTGDHQILVGVRIGL